MERRTAILLLASTALLWSTGGLVIKLMDLNPLALAGVRGGIAALVLWLSVRRPRFTGSVAQIGGALGYVGAQVFFVTATQLTSAANAIFIQYTAPLYVALLGWWILRERPSRADWTAMILIGGGMLLFFSGDLSGGHLWGNFYALMAGVSFACMVVFMRMQRNGSPIETLILGNILAGLLGIPFLWGQSLSLGTWAGLLYLGLFQMGLAALLYSRAAPHLTAMETVIVQTLEPVLNPLWVFLVIGETPASLSVIGGCIVMGAIFARAVLGPTPVPAKVTPVV